MTQYFKYELAAFPTSLFKDKVMRKTQKSQLAKALTTGMSSMAEHFCTKLNGQRKQDTRA